MINAIFYKEWIKTRWYLLLSLVVTLGFVVTIILRIKGIMELVGAAHIWEVMITRDAIFVDILKYVPLTMGVLLAIVQFVPEMYHKSLKLTLHLPCSQFKVINSMLLFGVATTLSIFILNYAVLAPFLYSIFPVELYSRMLLTALPWYLAGLAGYLLISWVVLEPTWRRRLVNIVISILVLSIYMQPSTPEAYNDFLLPLAIFTLFLISLSWLSVIRFKIGKQD